MVIDTGLISFIAVSKMPSFNYSFYLEPSICYRAIRCELKPQIIERGYNWRWSPGWISTKFSNER